MSEALHEKDRPLHLGNRAVWRGVRVERVPVVSVWSWLYLIVLAVVVPYLSARSQRAASEENLSRIALYANLCVGLWVLAALGFLVVKLDGQTLADVYVTTAPLHGSPATFLGWTITVAAGGLLVFALSHLLRRHLGLPAEEKALIRMRPTGVNETVWILLVVSPTAGVCEEFLYRGFLLSRIETLVASPATSAFLAAAVFGMAHLYQGWPGAVRAAVIALMLAAPVVRSGTVLPAMAAHALIDAGGILWLWPRLERRWGAVP